MSRKSKSFSQLYDYFMRDKSSKGFSKNTYSDYKQKKEFLDEFYTNAKYLKNSRGKVYIYHEILSLEKNFLSSEKQKEILLDIAKKYLDARADNHLSFAVLHEDKEHIHVHIMISANEMEGDRRIRLSKKEFASIQKNLENYKNQRYPELNKSSLYQEKKDLKKDKRKEQELKSRGSETTKDEIKRDLRDTFEKASSHIFVQKHLQNLGYELYTRGKTNGVIYKGKKYRLNTLGLEEVYKQMNYRLEAQQQREIRRQEVKEDRKYSRER